MASAAGSGVRNGREYDVESWLWRVDNGVDEWSVDSGVWRGECGEWREQVDGEETGKWRVGSGVSVFVVDFAYRVVCVCEACNVRQRTCLVSASGFVDSYHFFFRSPRGCIDKYIKT